MSIIRDILDPLGLHLNQKDLKSGKQWLSYGQFTGGRLRDSSEYHAGCMGSIRALFEPKRSKIGQEMAELCQFTIGRLRDSGECQAGCTGSIRASCEPKISEIGQETAEFWPIYDWEVA